MSSPTEDHKIPANENRRGLERLPSWIERQILAVSNGSPADQLVEAIDASDWLLCRARSIQVLCKQVAIDWIEHNGDLTVGPIRYHVGYTSTTRCTDPKRCGITLLEVLGGDFERFLDSLVAQPYKPTHVRSVVDAPAYRSLFVTQSTTRLINGVPERTLNRSDSRFVVPRAQS